MFDSVIRKVVRESIVKVLNEAQMDFGFLYSIDDGTNITEYVFKYLNWSAYGERDPQFSILASKLHDSLMYLAGLDHESDEDRRLFSRMLNYIRYIDKTVGIEYIRYHFDEWEIKPKNTQTPENKQKSIDIKPYNFRHTEPDFNMVVAYETRDGIRYLKDGTRVSMSDPNYVIPICLKAEMTPEKRQEIIDMNLVPALFINGTFHYEYIEAIGVLPKYVQTLQKIYKGEIFFECKFDLESESM